MTWYIIQADTFAGAPIRLVQSDSPEQAVEAAGFVGTEVAVYVADYIGRFDVRNRPVVTRLSNARTGGTIPPGSGARSSGQTPRP